MSRFHPHTKAMYGLVLVFALCAISGVTCAATRSELSKVPATVSIATGTQAATTIVLETRAVAVKETGPKATVAKFGEVYAYSPSFFVVRQNQPTAIQLWNLQPDDVHDFELLGPQAHRLIQLALPPLARKSYVFDFHRPGLYTFKCTIHQPEMNGQILVLPTTRG